MRKLRYVCMALGLLAVPATSVAAQQADLVGYSSQVSSRRATLELQYADGTTRQITFSGGQVRMGDAVLGQYTPGGTLERVWREILTRNDLSTSQVLAAIRAIPGAELAGPDVAALASIQSTSAVPPAPAGVEVPPLPTAPVVPSADASVELPADLAPEIAADVARDVRTQVRDAIRTNVRNGIRIEMPDVGTAAAAPPLGSVPGGLLALFGTLLALSGLALGTSFFAERQLDVMADTVQHSLARSFFVGLFAQPLVIPALGALVVGLTLTVVGILVIPFAVVGFVALLAVGLVGGYLAVARATGATFQSRRGKDVAGGMSLVKSIVIGLALLLALWLPAVLLGWVPVMGTILRLAAGILTWGLVTTGFGAAILTRGGVRGTFGRRFAPAPVPFSHQLEIPDEEESAEGFTTAEWLAGKAK